MNTSKHRFFVPPASISGTAVVFSQEETRHATRVLRLEEGDEVTVVDGEGWTYLVSIETIQKRGLIGLIKEKWEGLGEATFKLHVGLAVLKQSARWESFLEKAVESGCTRISPVMSERTQVARNKFNRRRAESILVGSLKQSERSRLPKLDDPVELATLLAEDGSLRLIFHESLHQGKRFGTRLGKLLMELAPEDATEIRLVVGPEGGFSEAEVKMAIDSGWIPVWLGKRRLRAETAAITAVSMVAQIIDERFEAS